MKRLIPITFLASITTFSLFAFMAYLISSDEAAPVDIEDVPIVEVYQTPDDSKVIERPPVKLTPPPPPMPAPKMDISPTATVAKVAFEYQPPILNIATSTGLGTINGPADTDARPIVRVNPKYPITAAQQGIEGWVKLSFNINEIGQVTNVEIIDAEPQRVFDKEAKRALKKWKYRAKVIDGKPVAQENLTVQLDFNISQQS